MDAMNSIGSFITGKGGQGLLTGVSAISNFLAKKKQNDYLNNQINYQKMVQGIVSDPAKLAARAKSLQAPLDQGLIQGVGNEVQAYNASRGLSTSPQIQSAVLAQALGPYMQYNQDAAMQEAISSLGVPIQGQTPPNFGSPLDLSSLIKALLKTPDVIPISDPGGSVIPKPGITDDVPPNLDPSIFGPQEMPNFPMPNTAPQAPGGTGGGGGDAGMSLDDILQFAF